MQEVYGLSFFGQFLFVFSGCNIFATLIFWDFIPVKIGTELAKIWSQQRDTVAFFHNSGERCFEVDWYNSHLVSLLPEEATRMSFLFVDDLH